MEVGAIPCGCPFVVALLWLPFCGCPFVVALLWLPFFGLSNAFQVLLEDYLSSGFATSVQGSRIKKE
jgi:hypothetical protein